MPFQYSPHFRRALPSVLLASIFLLAGCGGGQTEEGVSDDAETMAETEMETAQAIDAHSPGITWKTIATEGSHYTFKARRYVRYGSGSKWVGQYVDPSVPWRCGTGFFGADPAPGVSKVCQVPKAGSASPTPAGSARLSWQAASGSVKGYRVYWGTAPRQYDQARGNGRYVTGTTAAVPSLAGGRTYYFAVTAVDTAGNESGFSNEATKTVP